MPDQPSAPPPGGFPLHPGAPVPPGTGAPSGTPYGAHPGPPGPHGFAGPPVGGPGPWAAGPQVGPGPWQQPPVSRAALAVTLLRVACLVLVLLGLSIPFDPSCDWATRTTWAIFALAAAVGQLLPAIAGSFGWDTRRGWTVGAVATGALAVHWLLITLPSVTSNAGFCLTLGTAAAVGAVLLAPGRPR